MKNYSTPWSVGSMFICNKCGIAFGKPDNAEDMKKELRGYLKEKDAHKDVRVMVSGCLNICDKNEQAVLFQSVTGPTQVFTIDKGYNKGIEELKSLLDSKIKK